MTSICSLLDNPCKKWLSDYEVRAKHTRRFEKLKQNSGFMLYETKIRPPSRDPSLLWCPRVRDRAYIYMNKSFVAVLRREMSIYSTPISLNRGQSLQIFLENEGRMSSENLNDRKGFLGKIVFAYRQLTNWNMKGFSFNNYRKIEKIISKLYDHNAKVKLSVKNGPILLHAEFDLKPEQIHDTYINCTGWGKVNVIKFTLIFMLNWIFSGNHFH